MVNANWIKRTIEEDDSKSGRAFDLFIQSLIVVSLITFSIETLPSLSATTRKSLRIIELITVVFFTSEYLLRVVVAENKRNFVFSFFGIVDLLAILPFYLSTGIDLRSVRAFRLLRLFRVFKIADTAKRSSGFIEPC